MQPIQKLSRGRRRDDRGQVSIFVVLALGIFLLGFVGFAVDMTNLWFHRQMAQTAADASCQAGIIDILTNDIGNPTPKSGFTAGTNFDCSTSYPNVSGASPPAPAPCIYANLNGYSGQGLTAGAASNQVAISFPANGTAGLPTPPPSTLAPVPYLRADVTDRVPLTFARLLSNSATMDVKANAVCALALVQQPVPIIVLNPTCPHSFEVSGSATLTIVGGPPQSVQVNSENTTCAAATQGSGCNGSGTIDLSQGGPSFSGSSFGVTGAPTTQPTNFTPSTGNFWQSPHPPINDPYAQVAAPPVPALPCTGTAATPCSPGCLANPCSVGYTVNGCPDHSGCVEYAPGLYNAPIVVKGQVAIFDPGIYYIKPTASNIDSENCGSPGTGCVSKPTGQCYYGLAVDSNGMVRPSTATGDGSKGTMFYLTGPGGSGNKAYGSVFFGANSGKSPDTVDQYDASTGNATNSQINCPGGEAPESKLNLQ
jgi:hypothetical protein